jgi:hypothetical protein
MEARMMGQSLSMDLWTRLLAAIDAGDESVAAAARFGMAPWTALRWQSQQMATGSCGPKQQGGDMLAPDRGVPGRGVGAMEARQDIALDEFRVAPAGIGLSVANSTLHRFFARPGITRQKRPRDQTRSARVLKQRRVCFEAQIDLAPEPLVYIDETSTATKIKRSHGAVPKGERLRMGFPHGCRKTTTPVAALCKTGMVAMVLDGPINLCWFEAYVSQVLVPELKPGDVVIMDDLSGHKARRCVI